MSQQDKVIVAIHAHPDDTEAFCSGTLALLKNAGYRIVIVTMTAGGMGSISLKEKAACKLRKIEAKNAAAVLSANYYCLEQRDGYVYDNSKTRIAITEIVRKEKATVVLTHLPFDYHADHRATCSMVEAGVMLSTLPNVPCKAKPLSVTPLLYHTTPLGLSDPLGGATTPPHFYIDITSVMEVKMKMLSHHHSQIELMRVMHKMENFFDEMKKQDIALGKIAGVPYAEALWQHLGGGFQKQPLLQNDLNSFIRKIK
jgi:LmbE family N-acetylglucosaminyl deacetylase